MKRLSMIVILLAFSFNTRIVTVSPQETPPTLPETCEPITATNADQVKRVAELETGELLLDIAWSPEQVNTFAVAGESGAWVYDLANPDAPQLLQFASHRMVSVAYSPNGTVLAAGDAAGNLLVWNIAHQEWIVDVPVSEGGINAVTFSSDSTMLASGSLQSETAENGTIALWDTATWTADAVTPDGADTSTLGSIHDLAFDPSGTWLAAATAHNLLLLDMDTGALLPLPAVWIAWDVEFDPSGQILAAATATSKVAGVWLWNTVKNEPLAGPVFDEWVRSVAFAPSGDLLATGIETFGNIVLWDITANPDQETGDWIEITHRTDTVTVEKLAFSPDSKFLASVAGSTVSLWGVCESD